MAIDEEWMDDAMCERIEQQAARITELEAVLCDAERALSRFEPMYRGIPHTPEGDECAKQVAYVARGIQRAIRPDPTPEAP